MSPLYNLNSHVLFVPFKFIPFLFVSGIVGLATYVFYKKLYKIYYVLSIQLTSGSVNSFVSNNYSCIKETWRILEQIIEKGNIVNKKVTVDLKNGSIDGNIIISDTNEYLDFGDKTINN